MGYRQCMLTNILELVDKGIEETPDQALGAADLHWIILSGKCMLSIDSDSCLVLTIPIICAPRSCMIAPSSFAKESRKRHALAMRHSAVALPFCHSFFTPVSFSL